MPEVGVILVFGLGVFSLFSLLTYAPSDPSLFSNAAGPAQNACGKIGAFLSSLILGYFGLGAFLMPAILIFIAASMHRREGEVRVIGIVGGMVIATLALSVFLTLQWKYWPYGGSLLLTGGIFGVWLADLLVTQFNSLGSSIVSLLIFFTAIALSTPLSVARFSGNLISVTSAILWRFTKLILTYLTYLLGLLAMRTAHKSGDLIQKLIETTVARAKERAERKALERARAVSELALEGTGSSIEGLEAESDGAVKIGLEGQAIDTISSEDHCVEGNSEIQGFSQELSSEVAPAGNIPLILPPELNAETTSTQESQGEAESRAKEKLARLARLKRTAWKHPSIEFLLKPPKLETTIDREKLIQNSHILKQKFADFGIDGEVTAVRPGPVITLYEFRPGPGIKLSRIAALSDDLSMALSAQSVRILAPLPGKSVVGIEIPSESREMVYLREFLQQSDFYGPKHHIPIVMGKDIGGQPHLADLARMPHLLCAGQTGSGKSVFMNGLICSLLYRFTPDELRMILVDPKFIEFRAYQDMPHLLLPVVDDPKHASVALKWAVREMERRYRILALLGARNLATFNQKVEEMGADVVHDLLFSEENRPENLPFQTGSDWIEAFEPDESGAPKVSKLPFIVVIIDELADLMMIARKEVEISIARLAQKARAAGIHLVAATQRPSTDVITGLIKANLPSRVSFQLASFADSKTILDRSGAERLLGQGDMLFAPPGHSQLLRLHGAFVEDGEINKITAFLRAQGKPAYRDEILIEEEEEAVTEESEEGDEMFREAIVLIKNSKHASASFLQRHLKIGYNRAARMIEVMEAQGIVGPADGARPREVLMR